MTEKTIRRYCRAVGSYLPCARRQKRQLLRELRQRLEEYRDEHPDETSPEERFGTPQQVAAGYVDDMDTTELLQALRYRRRVITATPPSDRARWSAFPSAVFSTNTGLRV